MATYFKENEVLSIVEQATLLAHQGKCLFVIPTVSHVRQMDRIGSYHQKSKIYDVYGIQDIEHTYLICLECSKDIIVHNIAFCNWLQEPKFVAFKMPFTGFNDMHGLPKTAWHSFQIRGYQHKNTTNLVWLDLNDDKSNTVLGAKTVVW